MSPLDVDPSWVRPGWGPLLVVSLLAVVMVFLFISMQRQMRKIHVPGDPDETTEDGADTPTRDPGSGRTPPPPAR